MKRYLSYLIFISCLMILTPLYAGTQTLTTYYPAPQGNYKNMTVNNILTFPEATSCTEITAGTIGVANIGGVLELCNSGGPMGYLQNNTMWDAGPSGGPYTWMYPQTSTLNVGIGMSTAPAYNLEVTGTFGATGNATLGSAGTNTTTINGAATVSSTLGVTGNTTLGSAGSNTTTINGAATVSSTLGVTGNTTLGSAGTNTTTINGAATVSSTLGVTGNVTLGAAGSNTTTINGYINGSTVINGAANVNASSGVNYCTGTTANPATGCEALKVASSGSGGTLGYYAVYAP